MKFGDFNKLACGDRVTLVSAIDILMQVGQNYVRELWTISLPPCAICLRNCRFAPAACV